jgi:hypothetical protein
MIWAGNQHGIDLLVRDDGICIRTDMSGTCCLGDLPRARFIGITDHMQRHARQLVRKDAGMIRPHDACTD